MKKTIFKFITIFIFLFFIENYAKEPDMFLCVDSMRTEKTQNNQEPQKLVYGYVNGKKTPCMTEYELRVYYSKEAYQHTTKEIEELQKKTLKRNAIYRGEKNLVDADLRGMDLQGIDLSGADLRNALLESADLRNANLNNSNLSGANLKDAYCKNANFTGANFSNTQIQGGFFQNANLTETKGLTVENLCKVASLYNSKLDALIYKTIQENYPTKLAPPKGSWTPKNFDTTPDISTQTELANPKNFK